MTVTTTYTCDRCGTTQPTAEQFWEVRVSVKDFRSSFQHHQSACHVEDVQWCRKCVEALHLLPPAVHDKEKIELPPEPTLEEILREIIREEIEDKTGAA